MPVPVELWIPNQDWLESTEMTVGHWEWPEAADVSELSTKTKPLCSLAVKSMWRTKCPIWSSCVSSTRSSFSTRDFSFHQFFLYQKKQKKPTTCIIWKISLCYSAEGIELVSAADIIKVESVGQMSRQLNILTGCLIFYSFNCTSEGGNVIWINPLLLGVT